MFIIKKNYFAYFVWNMEMDQISLLKVIQNLSKKLILTGTKEEKETQISKETEVNNIKMLLLK